MCLRISITSSSQAAFKARVCEETQNVVLKGKSTTGMFIAVSCKIIFSGSSETLYRVT